MANTRIVITIDKLQNAETIAMLYAMLPLTVHQSSELYRILVEKTGRAEGADRLVKLARLAYNSIA